MDRVILDNPAITGSVSNGAREGVGEVFDLYAKRTLKDIEDNGYSTFAGGVVNAGAITATSDDGLLIEDNGYDGTFLGGIVNNGAILSGDDDTAFTMYALGGHGVISVTSNVAPREMSEMWDAAARGDWPRARALHYKVRTLNAALFCETNPIPVKAAVALLGRCANELRAPMYPAQPQTIERLKKVMTAEGWL